MKKLTSRLRDLCGKHSHWSVSGAEDPGEGEHKVMAKLRARPADTNPVLIYGLDADLILLTLLNAKSPAYLVREDSSFGNVILNQFGEEDLSYLSIDVLKQTLPTDVCIPEYVAAMSLLGNDFLPHSLTIKIKDDGHVILLKSLEELHRQGGSLITHSEDQWRINHDSLWSILKTWAEHEEKRMLATIKKKVQLRGRVQMCLDTKPLEWLVEAPLVWKGEAWNIHPQWREVYHRDWLQCKTLSQIHQTCREYLYGLQWVIDYYTGQRPVNMQWSFSRLVPPLWGDLISYLERDCYEEFELSTSAPIQPSEQLAMVLPLESWHFIEEPSLRSLPSRLPQFWPEHFEFFSAGRIHMWECEPLLPSLPVDRIRDAVKQTKDCAGTM